MLPAAPLDFPEPPPAAAAPPTASAKAPAPARAAAAAGAAAGEEGGEDEYEDDDEGEYEDEDDDSWEDHEAGAHVRHLDTAGFGAHEDDEAEEGEDEGAEDGGGGGGEGGSGGGGGGGGGDFREARGWQRLDRKKMEALVAKVLAEQEAKAAAAGGAGARADAGGGGDQEQRPAAARPVLGGLTDEAVHFNSATARPARRMAGAQMGRLRALAQGMRVCGTPLQTATEHLIHSHLIKLPRSLKTRAHASLPPPPNQPLAAGKKAVGPGTRGVAAAGAPPGVVVWLRQELRVRDNALICEAARAAAAAVRGGRGEVG